MKGFWGIVKIFIFFAISNTISTQLVSLGEPSKQSSSFEPRFTPLEEGQGSYTAQIYDDKNVMTIKDITFSGQTSVGGVRSEKDDSIMRLKLSKIKEIIIVKSIYQSQRFRDQDFALASVTTINDKKIDQILIPRGIVICGVEDGTQIERAWFINRIDKLVITSGVKPIKKGRGKKMTYQEIKEEKAEEKIELGVKAKQKNMHHGIMDAIEGIFGAFYDLVLAIFYFFVRLAK